MKTEIPTLYHESRVANYYRYSNGLVIQEYKTGKVHDGRKSIRLSNDDQGHDFLKTLTKLKVVDYVMYRCPKDGQPYSSTNCWSRIGHVKKSRAKVIQVVMK